MQEVYSWLSGNVPGGFLLLSFILLTVNVALYLFFRTSKLFSREVYRRRAFRYNSLIFLLYIFLWVFLRPPELPPRYAVLPFQKGDSVDVRISNALEYTLAGKFDPNFILHRWEWFYQTANKDSVSNPIYRDSLALRLGIDFLVKGKIREIPPQIEISCAYGAPAAEDTLTLKADSYEQAVKMLIAGIQKQTRKFAASYEPADRIRHLLENATLKKRLLDADPTLTNNDVREDDMHSLTLQAEILLSKGISQKPKQAKASNLVAADNNPYFQRLQKLLIPYSREGKDTPEMNLVLGEMFLHKGNYGMAEICLEKALSQDRYNARIYYFLSFLHESRIEEYGFDDRKKVLERALQLDPGYTEAALLLADEYYFTGSGTATGHSTQQALLILKNYLKINPLEPDMLNLLGRIYLQTKFTREAMAIYRRLVDLYPDSAKYNYNLAISLYHLKEYDAAEDYFRRAIEISDELDAYLYLGAIYKQRGQLETALVYFRERIRRKSGPEDYYAKEAMRQVRIVRADLGLDTLDLPEGE